MDTDRAKRYVEESLHYEGVKQILVKLVQFPSPQTELLEEEPKVLALIKDVVNPELEKTGIRTHIDDKGNLNASLKGVKEGKRLLLVGYAMNAMPSTMLEPYSGKVVGGEAYGIKGECVWGRGACEQKGSLAAMIAAFKLIANCKEELPGDITLIVRSPFSNPLRTILETLRQARGHFDFDKFTLAGIAVYKNIFHMGNLGLDYFFKKPLKSLQLLAPVEKE